MSPTSEWGVLRSLAASFLLAGLAALTACGRAPSPAPVAAAPSAATLQLGRDVYNFRCYFCHGYSGDAKTLAASYLDPKPRDFQNTKPEELPVERILAAVKDGRPGTAMKGFTGILNEQEMQAVS